MGEDIATEVQLLAREAKEASTVLAQASDETRSRALRLMAKSLRANHDAIVAANRKDMQAGREAGMKPGLLDRLELTDDRLEGMASALEQVADLPDPVGRVLEHRTIDEGLDLTKVTVPLGLVAMIYEARPNVTADAAGVCLKSGNACILRGGSQAAHSNVAIARALRAGVTAAGLPEACVTLIETTDRKAADVLMSLRGTVDVLIPRGSAGLIRHCLDTAKVPVIETGSGVCHTYFHRTADLEKGRAIILNAKTQRTGVCNACETMLYDRVLVDPAKKALKAAQADDAKTDGGLTIVDVLRALSDAGVTLHVDQETAALCRKADIPTVDATDHDWECEYGSMDLAVRAVQDVDAAIEHINTYGTMHSECIIANPDDPEGAAAIEAFLAKVDAAVVYANASTRFSDGGCFGLGAEIGIATQKLHVRGPFATEALTSYKYIIRGNGQVRK